MMKNIVINVGQENKGLNVSIGYILAEEYGNNVKFIVENIFAEKEVKALYPAANVVNFSSLNCDIEEDKVVDTALDIESSYNIKFSSIMASTRDFGRGYLVNIGNFPNIGRSNWDYKKKLSYVISETLKWVEILHGQDIYMQKWIGRIPSFVAKKYGVKTLSLVPVKYGDRFMWSDNSYNTSKAFIDAIKKNRSEVVNNKFFLEEENNFILEGTTKLLNSRIKYTYLYAFKRT